MNPQNNAQDVLRCDLCNTPVPQMYCDMCHVNLCKSCVGEHLLEISKEHKVVPFELRGSTIKCQKHSTKICELHCEQCNVPVCLLCVSSKEHTAHDFVDILKSVATKKKIIQKDLQELENVICPNYQEAVSNTLAKKAEIRENSQKLSTVLKERGDIWHKEIDTIIQIMQSEIDDVDSKNLESVKRQEDEINNKLIEITESISEIKKMLSSDDIYFLSSYKSRIEEFRIWRLPTQFEISLPKFTPQEINRDQIYQQFGSLTIASNLCSQVTSQCSASSPPLRHLIDEPRIITDITTVYEKTQLHSMSCLNDSEFWTCGSDEIIRLYNIQGKLLQSVKTRSGNKPRDIAVTNDKDLVYSDPKDRSISIVKDTQPQPLIKLFRWIPSYLCITFSGDLLVTMTSDDKKQTKIVRYSGSIEKQNIQWDNQGKPLFKSDEYYYIKYLSENRNLDICVADYSAYAVIVVTVDGRFRFRYTGTNTGATFKPVGIATDSQGRILIADWDNKCIHILDQNGHFPRYINNCGLLNPRDLCIDSSDNLFVTEENTGKVRKIQYYK